VRGESAKHWGDRRGTRRGNPQPGVCIPWKEKVRELPPICGDPDIPRRVWNDIEGLAYLYIWHVPLSF